VNFTSYEALHYTIHYFFLPLRNKYPPQQPVCGKVSYCCRTPDTTRNECLKKIEVCGVRHCIYYKEEKLNGDEGYQTVPSRPFGKCKLQTIWNPGNLRG